MITAKVSGDWKKKLKGLQKDLKGIEGTEVIIRPTKVIKHLSAMKGRPLLATVTTAHADRAKARVIGSIQRAVRARIRGRSRSTSTWRPLAIRAYESWARHLIDELYLSARSGQWGPVTNPRTLAAKRRAGATGQLLRSWGVRRSSPSWRDVQKGLVRQGRRSMAEPKKSVEVRVR